MRAGAGVSTALDPKTAIREAAELAVEGGGLSTVDFALVLVTAAHGRGIYTVAEAAADTLGVDELLGTSVEGVISAGQEVVRNPAVAVLALEQAEAIPFVVAGADGDEAGACAEVANTLGAPLGSSDLVVVFPDPLSMLPQRLLPGLESVLGDACVIGGAAGALGHRGALSWTNDAVPQSGALGGFLLRGGGSAEVSVTQACRFVTQPLEVTRGRGNWILSIDGRPALDVYRQAAGPAFGDDLENAARHVMVGFVGADDQVVEVRHVVGFDADREAISLPRAVQAGDRVRMALIDPETARHDLGSMLEASHAAPGLGLYFNCRARGEALFGVSGLEAGYLERRYGSTPIVGSFGAFQISPRGTTASRVLTYAGVLALLG